MSVPIRKDHWSPTEDDILRSAVMKYGTNQWNRVASLLSRKSARQCKSRWAEHLDPRISARGWTSADDELLLELAKKMPNMWRSIGTAMGNRTAQQSYERWQALQSKPPAADDESSGSEMGSDAEKQLVAEARARLSNSMGRKAKRKRRERLEDENRFLESVDRHRKTGARIAGPKSNLTVPQVDHPGLEPTAEPLAQETGADPRANKGPQPRRPNRPKLALPPPVQVTEVNPTVSEHERRRVAALLETMPPPNGNVTLADIVSEE